MVSVAKGDGCGLLLKLNCQTPKIAAEQITSTGQGEDAMGIKESSRESYHSIVTLREGYLERTNMFIRRAKGGGKGERREKPRYAGRRVTR